MRKFLLPFFLVSTLFPNYVYGNSLRKEFVDMCLGDLVGTYNYRTASKICDCTFDYWQEGGSPSEGGYICATKHGNIKL